MENLLVLWVEADLAERRNLLMAMLDEVYVGTVDEKAIVTIHPNPAFRLLFEIATTREGSGIALINQTPQTRDEAEASESCSWWKRGRVELKTWPRRSLMHSVISPGLWPAWRHP